MIRLDEVERSVASIAGASIKVIGVGGAGGNAVNYMVAHGDWSAVEFIVANTDAQSLSLSAAQTKVQLGSKSTRGLGAGSNPDVGRRAAEEDLEEVVHAIAGADILFLTGGLGGGTGSGALPVIAAAAKELGILSVAIVTKPFAFEGKRRQKYAEDAVVALKSVVDTYIVVPNQKLLEVADPKIAMVDAFNLSNNVLRQAIKGISDIITFPGLINVDFADVRTVMRDMGHAIMGSARCSGQDRARKAAIAAVSSPLLENVSIAGARGVLINITGNNTLGLNEINEAATVVYDMVGDEANIILGTVINSEMKEDIEVTIIATGFASISAEATADAPVWMQQRRSATTSSTAYASPQVPPNQPIPAQPITEIAAVQPSSWVDSMGQPAPRVVETTIHHTAQYKVETDSGQQALQDAGQELDMDDVDTPTFLRKRAEVQRENNAPGV